MRICIAAEDDPGEKRPFLFFRGEGPGATENFIKFVISLKNRVKGPPLFRDKLAPLLKKPTVDTDAFPENQTGPATFLESHVSASTEDLGTNLK